MPNGDVYTLQDNLNGEQQRYILVKIREDVFNFSYSEEVLPGVSLFDILQTNYIMRKSNYPGNVMRFIRDLTFVAVLIAIEKYGYRFCSAPICSRDTTIEWLKRSLEYSMPIAQRGLVNKLLAKLVAEAL
jgi:hypothetical protein